MLTSNNNKFRVRNLLAISLGCVMSWAVYSQVPPAASASSPSTEEADPATIALKQRLIQRYPKTKFGDLKRTPMTGVWEVWMGANVAYVTDDIRYFLFGHLFDMQTQTDLTSVNRPGDADSTTVEGDNGGVHKVSFSELPLDAAIKVVRGNGRRKIAVFSDPDCPYCKQLEASLGKLKDVTVYTFLYPIDSLHPHAAAKSERIWCAKDRAAAWTTFMTTGKLPPSGTRCETPLERVAELGREAGINGTPFILFENGTRAAGALDAVALERRLNQN